MPDPIRDWQIGRIRKAVAKAFADSDFELVDLNDSLSPVDFFLTFARKSDPAKADRKQAVVTQDRVMQTEDALGAYLRGEIDPNGD
jgi:hypothetical protein